ncbi:Chemotaxis phosphatase CheX [Desulfatibacillum alkenivorans DSM 16219]|uniref:Chemotaxis phosphatase CheX n=1 Tax=Desulfatibacillum alkenivorans DSM 16219 TaxID=1121393 RepID=A0A1M6F565_9BACT|nr:chemotaxis protein CheX [Desulfatibacillum alkenivorans]SHI92739.1 Chemotaxis phosphatase CheX [Desulfatibacillum alkenivorans DSM 16219]
MTSSENVTKAVFRAMSDTFEGMAFMQISRLEDESPDTTADDMIWSRVDVKAPAPGFMAIAYTREVGVRIVESLYGMLDEPCSQEMLQDSLNEIVNTVIGRCMSLLVPAGQTFELGLPKTGEGWPDFEGAEIHGFSTMDGGQLLAFTDLGDLDLLDGPLEVEGFGGKSSDGDEWGDSGDSDDAWGASGSQDSSDDGWG